MRTVFLLLIVLAFVLEVPAQTDVVSEAERFAKESQFLRKQGRYGAALEKVEVAASLDPGNETYRRYLITALIEEASETVAPGRLNKRTAAPDAPPPMEREKLEQAIRMAERAQDLFESLPFEVDDRIYGSDVIRTLGETRRKLAEAVVREHPEAAPELNRLHRRIHLKWLNDQYPKVAGEVKDRRGFGRYMVFIQSVQRDIFSFMPPADAAKAYEKIFGDLADFSQKNYFGQPASANEIARGNLFKGFHEFSYTCRFLPEEKRGPELNAALDRIFSILENDRDVSNRIEGFIARNKIPPNTGGPETVELTVGYHKKLLKFISTLPEDLPRKDCRTIYREFLVVSRLSVPLGFRDPKTGEHVLMPYYREIVGLADSRNEFVSDISERYMDALEREVKRKGRNEAYHEDEKRIARQIELAEHSDREAAKRLHEMFERYQKDSAPKDEKPGAFWKEETVLLQRRPPVHSATLQRYHFPVIRDNTLYFFSTPEPDRLRFDSIDLTDFTVRERKAISYVFTSSSPLSSRTAPFVDRQNAYLGTRNAGLLVFPLDDSEPWTLTVEDGLPSNAVQGVGAIGGKLYLGLGEFNQQSWMVAVDLATKKIDILASSAGREGKVPFFNQSPAPCFPFFIEDAKRERLLFFATSKDGGLWAIDGKTGEFEYVKRVQGRGSWGQLLPDGDRLLVYDSFQTYLVDLKSPERDDAAELLFCLGDKIQDNRKNVFLTPKIPRPNVVLEPAAIFRDSYWAARARIPLDGKSPPETCPKLKNFPTFWPSEFVLPTPNGQGLLVGDGLHIIYLRFE